MDLDNIDQRMQAMKPRVSLDVANTLTGPGQLRVDLTFESLDDFARGAIARKVDALARLLEARQRLADLITYMDGKSGPEELIGRLLKDRALLTSLVAPAQLADATKAD